MNSFQKIITVVAFCWMSVAAQATIIAKCGVSIGFTYFPSIGLNKKDNGEFSADKISGGRISLELRKDGKFDVWFASGSETDRSSIDEGADVIRIGRNENTLTIAVIYPMLSEVYTFMKTRSGDEVMWTTNKHSTPILKAGTYLSSCTQLDLQ